MNTSTEQEYRDLLAAISELLSPPPATPGTAGFAAREYMILRRAAIITGAIRPVVSGQVPPAAAMHLRDLAAEPLPYEPEGGE